MKVFEYVLGSKNFKLDTNNSDTDLLVVYLDPLQRLSLNKDAKKYTVVEGSQTETEITYIELGEFLQQIQDGDLKYIEAGYSAPKIVHNKKVYSMVESFLFNARKMSPIYQREINRRYNKLFYKPKNPENKNFNKDSGYDSKFAAHLYRVCYSYQRYRSSGIVTTDFSSIRNTYLEIKSGKMSEVDFKNFIEKMYINQFDGETIWDDLLETENQLTANEVYIQIVRSFFNGNL